MDLVRVIDLIGVTDLLLLELKDTAADDFNIVDPVSLVGSILIIVSIISGNLIASSIILTGFC